MPLSPNHNIINKHSLEHSKRRSPEEKLLISLLTRAVLDLHSDEKFLRASAYRWLISKKTTPFSFIWTCNTLNLKPQKDWYKRTQETLDLKLRLIPTQLITEIELVD